MKAIVSKTVFNHAEATQRKLDIAFGYSIACANGDVVRYVVERNTIVVIEVQSAEGVVDVYKDYEFDNDESFHDEDFLAIMVIHEANFLRLGKTTRQIQVWVDDGAVNAELVGDRLVITALEGDFFFRNEVDNVIYFENVMSSSVYRAKFRNCIRPLNWKNDPMTGNFFFRICGENGKSWMYPAETLFCSSYRLADLCHTLRIPLLTDDQCSEFIDKMRALVRR